jgi:SAM-dependent methyltransferase
MIIGGRLGYHVLRWISPPERMKQKSTASAFAGVSKLEAYWGNRIWDELAGKTVIDFGCGKGKEVIDIAKHGAKHVIGLDILERDLRVAQEAAVQEGVAHLCSFATTTTTQADVIFSTDAFEHFADPAQILRIMASLLNPNGRVFVTFGPPWLHPKGGHTFSVFPWAHLIFTEHALIRWRSDFKTDGATRFQEVEGGLNQMTIRTFRKLVGQSELQFDAFEVIPIRPARWLCFSFTREFLTSIVRCTLRKRSPNGA